MPRHAEKRIISVSRRTDIPAFYGEWFLNRLKEGYVGYRNPFGGKEHQVSLKPEDVLCFVFWSKNYEPFLETLKTIDDMGYNSMFNFTITGLPNEIFEPNVAKTDEAIETLKILSDRYSPRHTFWRYDPIVISDRTGPPFHLENFNKIASRLKGHVNRCIISYVDIYDKVQRNFKKLQAETQINFDKPDKKTRTILAEQLAEIAQTYGIETRLYACCEDYLTSHRITRSRCVDGQHIGELFGIDTSYLKNKPTRDQCGCTESTDIGAYDACPHGCVYCYANVNKDKATKVYENHDKESVCL
jgi:DNA repair photolyase